MEFSVQIQGLDALVAKLRQAPEIAAPILQRALSASSAVLAKHTVKGIVPWKTGFLAQTFKAEMTTGMLRWFPTASYAPYVEFGTAPPVSKVNHPGNKPNAFMERIVSESQGEINDQFGVALQQIVTAFAA